MVLYTDFHYYWILFELVNGIIISILSALNIYAFFKHRKDNAPIVSWALNLKNSRRNFSILLFATVLFVIVFLFYFFGSLYNNDIIKMFAESLGTFTYLLISYVIISWSKLFLRFI